MLLRRLLHRLELDLDSPKLRILAASASLGDSEEAARTYLEEFFGVDRASFAILRGIPRDLGPLPSAERCRRRRSMRSRRRAPRSSTARRARRTRSRRLSTTPRRSRASIASLCGSSTRHGEEDGSAGREAGGRARRCALPGCRPGSCVESPSPGRSRCSPRCLAPQNGEEDVRVPVRAHLFFRTVPGWWACARADCPAVPEQFTIGDADRREAVRAADDPLRLRRALPRPLGVRDLRRPPARRLRLEGQDGRLVPAARAARPRERPRLGVRRAHLRALPHLLAEAARRTARRCTEAGTRRRRRCSGCRQSSHTRLAGSSRPAARPRTAGCSR